ncbi:LysM peptidoglycan-binding domain-containing protein [Tetragenococcus halophilus]|uniref:LysM domain-containing protein n=1 Tax=Tetragenococcus halophilus (strain DSM 20338 / JCM 20259 / NCIMB 9735 / NBRC 12172) TaxID=945021 RepID=A0AAN1SIK5_TETHN|nr:LysM peptidoglycan-binding domain-containing protein [Tetragenococcus halophilus]MCF1602004.1 LysM peptidoglycan-binding domain-containing protein [Tetragenococcus halophilus]MDN6257116.1 LysM peptidoglycan-binding domain-containing protein [Tetragenococcus halophilus]MDN6526343.1 LysM peptidoglycan-binding domain-containing protein [Tetragenococcus halophilus]MDN6606427.1 LysM peptidoglycan-binding domain-containing protein [Tetragenococcus halophilus]RQD31125.1 LysM peptidoglycan-binding 
MKLKKLLLGTALTAGTVFAVGTTSANADEIHTIQQDDTLGKISKQYVGDKSLIDSIVEANDIKDKNMIYVGEELTIPTDGNGEQAPAPAQEAPVQEQQAPVQEAQAAEPAQPVEEEQTPEQPVEEPVQEEAPAQAEQPAAEEASSSNGGSTKDQFLAAGGTEEMWSTIVMPESGGNPNAVNPLGYQGLGQTKESWGTGSVEEQTKGMIEYGTSRYGSMAEAMSFRAQNNWW